VNEERESWSVVLYVSVVVGIGRRQRIVAIRRAMLRESTMEWRVLQKKNSRVSPCFYIKKFSKRP
jgi:hypothetical protein